MPFAQNQSLKGTTITNPWGVAHVQDTDMEFFVPNLEGSTTDPTLGTSPIEQGRTYSFGRIYYDRMYIRFGMSSTPGSGEYRIDNHDAGSGPLFINTTSPTEEHCCRGWGLVWETVSGDAFSLAVSRQSSEQTQTYNVNGTTSDNNPHVGTQWDDGDDFSYFQIGERFAVANDGPIDVL